jgi:hypothetical protein
MENTLLPVGSVVLLNGGKKRLVIYGLLQMSNESKEVYDYIGCYYPEGYISQEHSFLFNASDISEISYIGFIDSEYQVFDERLKKAVADRKFAESKES